jgi:hypothetical protein
MSHENKILHLSLFIGLAGILAGGVADAAVRIGNKTKNDTYRQIMAANAAAAATANNVATTTTQLAVPVANKDLAEEIQSGKSNVKAGQLETCARIYPNGSFAWDKPTAGLGAGGAATCVAVVELRGYQMGPGGSDLVLARANVAAGSGVKCNISSFPESSYTNDAQNVLFPADNEPTHEDVIAVMNQEQKQNAALKIAATTLVGAIGGNIVGKNDVGKDGLVGTDKGKMQGTLIGALGGAAIGAGGAYAGKVGGDMIMSAGVNAAAGGVVGNIMASGDSVLRIENCTKENGSAVTECLWGYIIEGKQLGNGETAYLNVKDRSALVCKDGDCKPEMLSNVKIKFNNPTVNNTTPGDTSSREINSLSDSEWKNVEAGSGVDVYHIVKENGKTTMKSGQSETIYVPIVDAVHTTNKQPALVWGVRDKFFGMKRSEWYDWKKKNATNAQIYMRDSFGNATGNPLTDKTLDDFEPMYVNAEDGGVIDLDNKARMKGTVIGAGAGGTLGAFTAYQGAQSDIEDRWVSAVREYKDSLQKFVCFTGNRFLSFYNDTLTIPSMTEQ